MLAFNDACHSSIKPLWEAIKILIISWCQNCNIFWQFVSSILAIKIPQPNLDLRQNDTNFVSTCTWKLTLNATKCMFCWYSWQYTGYMKTYLLNSFLKLPFVKNCLKMQNTIILSASIANLNMVSDDKTLIFCTSSRHYSHQNKLCQILPLP